MSNPNRPKWRTLSRELEELERINPDVKRAADNYHRTVARLNRQAKSKARRTCPANCQCICHDTGGSGHDHEGKPCPGKFAALHGDEGEK